MANLSDIIQGLIDTDRGIIGKLKTKLEDLTKKIELGSGSCALLDINNPSAAGVGTKVADLNASTGQSIYAKTTGSSQCLFSGEFGEVKFGHYALCVRVKTNNTTSSNLLQLKVSNGSTVVLTQNFTGANLGSTANYRYLYTTFVYEGNGVAKNNLKFELNSLSVSNVDIYFDYAYISMIIPAVFV